VDSLGSVDAAELLSKHWSALLANYDGEKRNKAATAQATLVESLYRLRLRYEAVLRAGRAFLQLGTPGYSGPFIGELQQQLVDATEAFHQGVYSVVSDLALVLSHRRKHGESEIPTKSNSAFLKHLAEVRLAGDPMAMNLIRQIRESTDYRAVFVDHRQQNKLYNWMTASRGEGFGRQVIYYHVISQAMSSDPSVQPRLPTGEVIGFPLRTDEVIPAPKPELVYAALQHLVLRVMGFVEPDDGAPRTLVNLANR
jgi:hypothetical protein